MTNTNTLTMNETQDIEQRVLKVSNLLKRSAQIWLEVSTEVNDAKHHLTAESYNIFLKKISLTTAIADKLLRVAKDSILHSDEMTPYINKFEGWSTLYEVTKLKADEKKTFINTLQSDPEVVVSREYIQSFRVTKQNSKSSKLSIALIKVNEADLLRLDYDQYLDLKEKLDDISRIVDRMSPVVSLSINDDNISRIENVILNANQINQIGLEEYCDEPLPITLSASNNDRSISHVTF